MADPDLDRAVQAALDEPELRVRPVLLPDGRRYWLKRVERLTGVMRLQKGDPARSFAVEREGMRELRAQGLPVAGLAAEGPGWILLPDAGPTLPQVVADAAAGDVDKLRAMAAAGAALGRLHWAGMVHGRPAMRDICWDGAQARFIDLELVRKARRGGWRQAADLLVLAQAAFTLWPEDTRWVEACFAAYLGPERTVLRSVWLARWLMPLGWLARGVFVLRPRSREARALGLMLAWVRGRGRSGAGAGAG